MFTDHPNIEKITDKVFIYKNFIDKDLVEKINLLMSDVLKNQAVDESQWNDWWKDKNSPQIPELYEIWTKIGDFIGPEYIIHPQLNMSIMRPGDEMYVHADSPGEEMEEKLIAPDMWNTCCIISYGLVVYFGDWKGGEVYYPHIDKNGKSYATPIPLSENNELIIKPEPGDLVIHGAHSDCSHGVKPVTEGIRYAYSNFMLKAEKNPGTFPAYGTQENEDRWNGGPNCWGTPIGFKWEAPAQVIEEVQAGNTGVRYRD